MKKWINPCHPRNPRWILIGLPMHQQNPESQRHTENAGHHKLPGTLHRNDPQHANAPAREKEVDRAFDGQSPADEGDDGAGESMPDVVKSHDEGAEREMNKGVQKTADIPFLAEHDEESNPDARLQDVGKTGDQEEEGREV